MFACTKGKIRKHKSNTDRQCKIIGQKDKQWFTVNVRENNKNTTQKTKKMMDFTTQTTKDCAIWTTLKNKGEIGYSGKQTVIVPLVAHVGSLVLQAQW